MQFVTVRDFRIRPGEVWERLKEDDLVVTSNGHPIAILTDVDAENLEETLVLLRRLRAQMAVSRMRQSAVDSGAAQLSADEVEAEIQEARAEQNS